MQLRAVIDTLKQRISPALQTPAISLYFRVSNKQVSSILVLRVDAGNPNPITTSILSKAEFSAKGLDAAGNSLMVSPQWSVTPIGAGAIDALGVFKPARGFGGNVRVFAQADGLSGEFNTQGASEKQFGLEVDHLIAAQAAPDTVANFRGCTVIFPDSIVPSDKTGLLQIAMPTLDNRLQLTSGQQTVVGSAFDITEQNGVIFQRHGADSIRLVLDIPEASVKNMSLGGYKLSLGSWNADSLQWRLLPNCVVNMADKTISANLTHFSRYAILVQSTALTSTLSILPNPFSPDKSPSRVSFPCPTVGQGRSQRRLHHFFARVPRRDGTGNTGRHFFNYGRASGKSHPA